MELGPSIGWSKPERPAELLWQNTTTMPELRYNAMSTPSKVRLLTNQSDLSQIEMHTAKKYT